MSRIGMLLQMAGVTALYVVSTVFLWHFWQKKTKHTLWAKLAVGLFYGLCSVAANHFGINYGSMVLNVRDLGPLAAGLFFDPLSGIISGLIGGIERYIVGEYFNIGTFTRYACGISTCLAGLLAAALHKWVYRGNRPSVIHCLFLGAEMEVFHMYAVFITHRSDITTAYYVVKTCALPMILFTGAGLMACSVIIMLLSGGKLRLFRKMPRKETPIDMRFQRWMLAVVITLFAFSFVLNYSLLTEASNTDARSSLLTQTNQYRNTYEKNPDINMMKGLLSTNSAGSNYVYILVDAEQGTELTGAYNLIKTEHPTTPEQTAAIVKHAQDGNAYYEKLEQYNGMECMCVCIKIREPYYLLIGTPTARIYERRDAQILETLFLEIIIFTALYLLTSVLLERIVVRNLEKVNGSLAKITAGHLNETVAVEESSEFTKLSEDINTTVTALRGYIDAAENRMKEDLKLAAAIQDAALPKNFRLWTDRIEIYALMTPARQVGGDFYDFFYTASDQIALVIADVSGKGIPASLFMMRAKTAIKNYARSGLGPAELLENVNNTLCEGNDADMFVTVWLGILDLKTGVMRCANAGHEYPALMRAGGDYELLKDKHGFVLAEYENIKMKEYEIQLHAGDRLFVYTDGVPEAVNANKEQYGTARMTESLNSMKNASQEQVLTGMLEDIRSFAGEEEQFDDITMLGITYASPGGEQT